MRVCQKLCPKIRRFPLNYPRVRELVIKADELPSGKRWIVIIPTAPRPPDRGFTFRTTEELENYPGVLKYMEKTKEIAKSQGFVETILGRRLYLPQINAKNKIQQQRALRTAINAPMQGSSADIVKQAMLDIQAWIDRENNDVKMIMQVHDELVFEMKANKAKEYAEDIRSLMSDAAKLSIPLVVDVGIGDSWQEAH